MSDEWLTSDELRETCRKWQRILRLQDWDITLCVVRQHVEPLAGGNVGACKQDRKAKEATIVLLDPIDYDSVDADYPSCRDQEKVLVHELVHLLVHVPRDGEEGHFAGELAVNLLADALVRLARGEER